MDLKTSISIHDMFSQPLQNMSNALNLTISSFESLQEISSSAVDTTKLRQAEQELNKFDMNFKTMQDEIHKTTAKQEEFTNEVRNTTNEGNKLLKVVGGMFGVYKTIGKFTQGFEKYVDFGGVVSELRAYSDASTEMFEVLTNKALELGATTSFTSAQAVEGMVELTKGGMNAVETYTSVSEALNLAVISGMELGQSAGTVVDVMRGFNLTANETGKIVDTLAYASVKSTTDISGIGEALSYSAKIADSFNATLEETTTLIAMMSASAKGSRAGTALRSGFGRLANPTDEAKLWADRLNVEFINPATKQLKGITEIVDNLAYAFENAGMSDANKIQASKALFGEQGYNAWLTVIEQGVGAMDNWLDNLKNESIGSAERMKEIMLDSTKGTLELFKSAQDNLWINFYNGLSEGVVKNSFQTVLDTILVIQESVLNVITYAILGIGYAIQFVSDNLDILIPILSTVLGVWLALNSATIIGIGIKVKDLILTSLQTAYNIAYAVAVHLATIKTLGLATAMAMLPINWIIGGIIVIIGSLYLVVAIINRVTGASISATGIIIGSLSVMGAFIYNLFGGIYNFILNIGVNLANGFISFAEFLINVFINPITAIGNLFVDLGDYVLGILSSIAKAIDFVFGSNLNNSIESWRSGLKGWATKFIKDNEVELDRIDSAKYELERMEYGSAWESGYNLGAGLGDSVKDFLSFDVPESSIYGMFPGLDDDFGFETEDMFGDIGDIAKDTKGIKDKLSATVEEIKYLRDLAAQKVINRYTTAEVTINQNNNMEVNKDMDLDGVFETLADGLEEIEEIVMEG